MREEARQARMVEIEEEAYALFALNGFDSTSMLAVAKAAKASNETMYRWYGDKKGLFRSMVQRNAKEVRSRLEEALTEQTSPMAVLETVAPVLLGMLLGERAILLNRAAASDPSGALGRLLAESGREAVLPLIAGVLQDAVAQGELHLPRELSLGPLFMRLLVGDRQVRRIIGTMPEPSPADIAVQAKEALAHLRKICVP